MKYNIQLASSSVSTVYRLKSKESARLKDYRLIQFLHTIQNHHLGLTQSPDTILLYRYTFWALGKPSIATTNETKGVLGIGWMKTRGA